MVTMSILTLFGYIAGALGFAATLAAALVMVRSSASKQTIESQKELIDTLSKGKEEQRQQIVDLQQKHVESSKAISELQGQVNVLQNIPLQQISQDLKAVAAQMTTLSKNQETIVHALEKMQPSAQ